MKPLPRRHDRWRVVASTGVVVVMAVSTTAVTVFGEPDAGLMAGPVPRNGCTVAALPGLADDGSSEGLKVSPSGRFILGDPGHVDHHGGGLAVPGEGGLALWHGQGITRMPHDLNVYDGGGVNSDGAVVGTHRDGSVRVVGKGEPQKLRHPEIDDVRTEEAKLAAINDSGDIAGTARQPEIEHDDGDLDWPDEEILKWGVVLWPGGSPEPVVVHSDYGSEPAVTAVTEDGRVLGYTDNGLDEIEPQPRIWDSDGTAHELPRLNTDGGGVAVPKDTAGDWVLSAGESGGAAYRWRLPGSGKPEELSDKVSATSIDSRGRVYGFSAGVPVMVDDDGIVELPVLGDAFGGSKGKVLDASNDGAVLTGLVHPADHEPSVGDPESRAVRWDCHP